MCVFQALLARPASSTPTHSTHQRHNEWEIELDLRCDRCMSARRGEEERSNEVRRGEGTLGEKGRGKVK